MRFAIAAIIVLVLVTACARPLKRFPSLFYLLAIAADIIYVVIVSQGIAGGMATQFTLFMQRCTLAFILLSVVMFVGVLPEGSGLRNRLAPLRRQLAILAFILALCHVMYYAVAYIARLATLSSASVLLSLGLSAFLVVLLVVLTVTSFSFVKAHMPSLTWKRIQKFAYPFYLLVYLHLLLLLLPGALAGKAPALISLSVYTAIVGCYVVLRLNKVRLDRKDRLGVSHPIG